MKLNLLLLGLLIGLAMVEARHYSDRSDVESADDKSEFVDIGRRGRDHSGQRHRRRSWQQNYGYDYPQPPNPYYPERRDNQDLMPQILRLLDEISAYVKRPQLPPPPPQPIYIPYPVPYHVPQLCNCQNVQPSKKNPNVTSRFPDMEDTNQNWGFFNTNENNDYEEENDGSRPISFVPIKSDRPNHRPAPSVEHGTNQAGDFTTKSPRLSGVPQARLPDKCDLYSLTCCNGSPERQRECLVKAGCGATYDNGRGCDKEKLLNVIDQYAKAYSPVH